MIPGEMHIESGEIELNAGPSARRWKLQIPATGPSRLVPTITSMRPMPPLPSTVTKRAACA